MKIAVYSKVGCGICVAAKKKIEMLGFSKVADPDKWVSGTWVERDVTEVTSGTSNHWREFPDCELLSFTMLTETEALPLIWIDNKFHTYAQAMKELKTARARQEELVAVPA